MPHLHKKFFGVFFILIFIRIVFELTLYAPKTGSFIVEKNGSDRTAAGHFKTASGAQAVPKGEKRRENFIFYASSKRIRFKNANIKQNYSAAVCLTSIFPIFEVQADVAIPSSVARIYFSINFYMAFRVFEAIKTFKV